MKRLLCMTLALAASYGLMAASGKLPYEFTYGGKTYRGFEGTIDGTLKVSVVRGGNPDFDESEYTVWFENVGDKPSEILKDVYAIKTSFKGSNPVLRGCLGDLENYYAQYNKDLLQEKEVKFVSDNGRCCHIVFPYFDLVHGNGGTRIALGWAGTWEATFSAKGSVTTLAAKTDISLETVLFPGEKVRTGLVVLMDYDGREEWNSVNKWRAWYMKYNIPKADAEGNEIKPFVTSGFAGDTGLPNSDGSISESYFTWKRTLTRLVHEDFLPDFRWFDAGWYFDPAGNTAPKQWWETVGSWELDTVKWPGKSFRESNEACHALGVKVLCWFEPERVTHVADLVKNHGFKEEWAIDTGWSENSDMGNPEYIEWVLGRITKMMAENEIDLYREDNNSHPVLAWALFDDREEKQYNVIREGINENKCVQGHYALWDGIIEFCRKNGKCTYLDSCAGGGGRNDIESMRRGIPFMRSDFDRSDIAMRLSQTSGLVKWLPFHGSSTVASDQPVNRLVPDLYSTRASLLPVWKVSGPFTHNPDYDFNILRRNREIWRQNNHLLTKDFYHLSEWHSHEDLTGWTVFAYNDPEIKEGILLAFRQEECQDATYNVALPFAKSDKTYSIKDDDTQKEWTISGKELSEGITLNLQDTRSSLLWHINEQ